MKALTIRLGRIDSAFRLRGALEGDVRPILLAWDEESRADAGGDALTWMEPLLHHRAEVVGWLGAAASGDGALPLLCCDWLAWRPRARWRLAPRPGAVSLLAGRLGEAGARRVWFGGGVLSSREACRSGWARASRASRESLLEAVEEGRAGISPSALALLRPLLHHQQGLPRLSAEALERYTFAMAFSTGDPREGVDAFLERREPVFKGTGRSRPGGRKR